MRPRRIRPSRGPAITRTAPPPRPSPGGQTSAPCGCARRRSRSSAGSGPGAHLRRRLPRTDPTAGSHEIWTVTNGDAPTPPPDVRIHLVRFGVLERNGRPVGPERPGSRTPWPAPGETARIAMTWGRCDGRFVHHCHQLGHASAGRTGRVDVKKRTH
ncbi:MULTISPECIES: multicopper oxidase domain-containing protein [Streptomyces]|nr:multicopper oxidase domain-containing protein [Streptomyces sp. McG7]MBT2904652.1 multicopper oxidase domain-containing protein [Streptomyces sp. McG8]MDX3417614.1 multicopper oxidase domain-containing protein [Streptomyces sp. MD20-1-1]MXQ59615.1 multicopper oxidase domain-containing protein [Streptomyces sp. XHT-2]MYQ31311.1 multicopper oxidase domain-containing protein [Streptomyces sp. SID4956]MYW51682.1 multicopper oxidase domain-containing protein [Streptomyces sp. SID8376]THC59497.1